MDNTIAIGRSETEVSLKSAVYITMASDIYKELREYVKHYDTEVSGCGLVEKIIHKLKNADTDKPDTQILEFKIIEVFLPSKQRNTGATTNIDDEEIHNIVAQLIKDGKDVEKLKLHWHSHVDMDTFHSTTDEDNYDTLFNGDYLVSLVINKAGHFLGRIDLQNPAIISISDVQIYVYATADDKVMDKVNMNLAKLDEYIKKEKETSIVSYKGYGNHAGYSDYGDDAINTANNWWDIEDEYEKKVGITIAETLHMTKKQKKKFDKCYRVNCSGCNETNLCQNYKGMIDDALTEFRRTNYGTSGL